MTSNVRNLLLKTVVSLTIGDANKAFLSHVVEDLPKDTAMDIMYEVNYTTNTSTEKFEDADYVGTIATAGTELMDYMEWGSRFFSEET